MPLRLTNKVAIFNGADNRVGRVAAELFALEGAKVVISDRSPAGSEWADELQWQGLDAFWHPCDISDQAAVKILVAATQDYWGKQLGTGPVCLHFDLNQVRLNCPPETPASVVFINSAAELLAGCKENH